MCREQTERDFNDRQRYRPVCVIRMFNDVDITLHISIRFCTCVCACTCVCICALCVCVCACVCLCACTCVRSEGMHSIVFERSFINATDIRRGSPLNSPSVRFLRCSPCTSKSRRKCLNLDHTPIIIYDMYTRAALPKRAMSGPYRSAPPLNVSIRSRKRLGTFYVLRCTAKHARACDAAADKTNCSEF